MKTIMALVLLCVFNSQLIAQVSPAITSQPQSQTIVEGTAATFFVTATGAPLNYQWQFYGTNILGATNSTLAFASAQATNAGIYSVAVSNSSGTVTSSNAVLQVLPPNAPSIQVNGGLAVETMQAIISAQITISGGFSDGFIFYTLDGTTPSLSSQFYAGSFTLTNTTTIRAICFNGDLSQFSEAPPVIVQVVPVYTLQLSWSGPEFFPDVVSAIPEIGSFPIFGPYPSNSVVTLDADNNNAAGWGQSWAFDHWAGDVTGNQNPLSLTITQSLNVRAVFRTTSCNLTDGEWGNFEDPVVSSIALVSATTLGGGSVTFNGLSDVNLAFYNGDGGWWDGWIYPTNCVATVEATASNGWAFLYWQGNPSSTNNPLIGQPANYVATFGTIVATNAVGAGLVVFGQQNPLPFGINTASAIPAAGQYFITWSGAASGTTDPTIFSVTNATPTVTALFAALPAGKFSLAPVVIGNGSVTVSPQQNYYNAGDIVTLSASGSNFYGWTGDILGTNNPLVVTMNSSKVIQANFIELPTVTVNVSPQTQIVYAGSNAVINANASGQPPLNYQWQNGQGTISGQTNATFAIINAQATDSGNYFVVVSNSSGSVTSAVATITVVFPPLISSQPTNQVVAAGSSLAFAVQASGTTPLAYRWLNSEGTIAGATNSTLILNPAFTNYTDNYAVVVSNPYGTATSEVATAFVYLPVGILSQPASEIVPFSGSATFAVTSFSFPAPTLYQWIFNGTNLPGATSNTLTINNVRLPNTGAYRVQVGNGYSFTNSYIAALDISPSIVNAFSGETAIWGTSATISVGAVGNGTLTYQWYFNGVPIEGATLPSLNFSSIQFTNGGLYSVVVSSQYGSVTNIAEQVVVNPAGISLGFYPGLTISGVAGYSYIIQSSTNLANTNSWVTKTNLTLTLPMQLWIDTNVDASSPFNTKTFYQVLPGQ